MDDHTHVFVNGKALIWNKGKKFVKVGDLEEDVEFTVVKTTDKLLYIERKLNG
jgi:hypothetical protein